MHDAGSQLERGRDLQNLQFGWFRGLGPRVQGLGFRFWVRVLRFGGFWAGVSCLKFKDAEINFRMRTQRQNNYP